MNVEKENSFSKFKNLFSMFENNKYSDDQKRISAKISQMIENQMLGIVFEYMDSGYKLNSRQDKEFYNQLNKIHSLSRMDLIDSWLKKGLSLPDKLVESQLSLYMNYLENYQILKNDPKTGQYKGKYFLEYYEKHLSTINTEHVYKEWKDNVDYYYKKVKNPIKRKIFEKYSTEITSDLWDKLIIPIDSYGEMLLKNKSVDEILKLLTKLEILRDYAIDSKRYRHGSLDTGLNGIINKLKKIPKQLFQQEIENDKNQIGILFGDHQINKLIAKENIKFNKSNNVKDLPDNAKDILENIKLNYLQLNKRLSDLNDEEKFTIDNLWNKRIPEIINKYLHADQEFRSSMKNSNGQSIEDLMIDSLNNIHDKLNEINMSHSKNVLHDMSAINRYTRSIK